jgi:hypothetical protein
MQYPYIATNDADPTKQKTTRVEFASVATWITTYYETPVILLVCRNEGIPEKLQSHLVSGNWNCALLKRDPARIFIDLLVLLTEWGEVWTIARQDLARRDLQVYTDELPVLRKTRILHRDAAEIIALREDLRLHVTAVRRFSELVGVRAPVLVYLGFLCGTKATSGQDAVWDELQELVAECLQNLLHQQESAAVIHKQLENLLNLVKPQPQAWKQVGSLTANFSGVQHRNGIARSGCRPPQLSCIHILALVLCRG